jgi:hypothetical protein
MPVGSSPLLLLGEKEKLIVLCRRAELFCFVTKKLQNKYMRTQRKNYFAKKWGTNSRQFQDPSIKPLQRDRDVRLSGCDPHKCQ